MSSLSQKAANIKHAQELPEYKQTFGNGIYNKYSHNYIPSLVETAQDDVGQLLDRQNRIYFVTTIGCISVIIFAVMLNSKR